MSQDHERLGTPQPAVTDLCQHQWLSGPCYLVLLPSWGGNTLLMATQTNKCNKKLKIDQLTAHECERTVN